ncbi:4080_t:CDS:2 [Acaulospora colombiana]|uniref:4080_t:CDS:1 n=1 Tax=Acaulospora colombiana TaxID=27376 RepID=A0ACA9K022_9GLOM|nr:4080_t:CDS:2 [Acaulospora colombiana]
MNKTIYDHQNDDGLKDERLTHFKTRYRSISHGIPNAHFSLADRLAEVIVHQNISTRDLCSETSRERGHADLRFSPPLVLEGVKTNNKGYCNPTNEILVDRGEQVRNIERGIPHRGTVMFHRPSNSIGGFGFMLEGSSKRKDRDAKPCWMKLKQIY